MASPDFRQYVDLTLFDRQPRDIYQDAVNYARLVLPELEVRPGTLEDALFQSMAFVGGELVASINRVPNGLMEGILNLMGLTRIEATFATGTAIFTMLDSSGGIITAGTQIGYTETVDGVSTFHTFRTVTETTVNPGSSTSPAIDIIADAAGAKPGLLSGQEMVVVSASNRILSAALASDLVTGEAPESDTEYFSRGATYLASLSSGLASATQIQNYILSSYPNVHRCKVYDLTKLVALSGLSTLDRSSNEITAVVSSGHGVTTNDIIYVVGAGQNSFNGAFEVSSTTSTEIRWASVGTNGSAAVTNASIYNLEDLEVNAVDQPGYVTIIMANEEGEALDVAVTSDILADVAERSVAGLTFSTLPPVAVPITATVTIRTRRGYSTLAVADAIDLYLTELLSPSSWDWSSRIRRNQIIARITGITGVDYVADLAFDLDPSIDGEYATIDEATGDLLMVHKGALPVAEVTVSESP